MATRQIMERLLVPIFLVFLYNTSPLNAKGVEYVTWTSVLKLMNVQHNVRLHSHDIKYGSGSGQQSVTGTEVKEDSNSYWLVKPESKKPFVRGNPIKCGETIRLEHMATKKNLHSHHVSSPLSGMQEVSAYGDPSGEGDTGDNWIVVCSTDYWERNKLVEFKHIDTHMYLSVSGRTYGSPIAGQMEVVGAYTSGDGATDWMTMEGIYIKPTDATSHMDEHDEL